VYHFFDTKKVSLDIANPAQFVSNAAQAILKKVVSKYPFESKRAGQLCLRLNSKQISHDLTTSLAEDLKDHGIAIVSFQFNELSYAAEIAQGMLKRQQAQALINARTSIVSGAIDIALGAVEDIEKHGVGIQAEDKATIITNLITLLSSETENHQDHHMANPADYHRQHHEQFGVPGPMLPYNHI